MIRPLLILAALVPLPAAAQLRFQDTTAIDVAVAAFTGHKVGEEGGARTLVDPRLKLAACPLPELDWRGTLQDAVVVRCAAPAWRIYVPVKLAPQPVRAPIAAAVSAAPLAAKPEPVIRRGDPITVEAGTAGFSITRDGVAMGDAVAGGRLMVRVDPAKPPIQAVAVETGRATLPGWAQ
ncbi:flagella basal body P-ring formation protein FlgA [Sphingomonas guangdongensis]|uniref:Flagella basal body P-ring formation protein FlgA n=1 Tax=Sphingomonas guangdongensis TaxID=1141890 RepID=A0A285QF86_9SPHN|nr:flagella basal body P-ring formation protein FlgA [Sphingomonas guangdongensis]SOB80188.1 flagella basal body P-ring formation protein FlgA [Sphingomonas guangdongensis]